MNNKVSFDALATLMMSLSEEEQRALIDSSEKLKRFAGGLVIRTIKNTFFVPLADNEVAEKLVETTCNWRKLAAELGYTGPVVWKVKEGFTLKAHAPKAGPCYKKFEYLQEWNIQKDEPTKNSLAFWVPRLVQGSKNKNVEEQIDILAKLRQRFSLSEHHLTSFGSASLNSGLILAHFKRTGDRVPLNGEWTRTDSFDSGGDRLSLGDFLASGLGCDNFHWGARRYPNTSCFPLGVEFGA
jgi:hypothetical protein